jgi:hypothetical protein
MPPGFLDDAWAEEEGEGEEEEEEVGAGKEAGTGKGARAGKKAGAAEAGVGAVGEGGASIPSDARRLADGLSARVSTLVLDECDAIIPGLKVRGKQNSQEAAQEWDGLSVRACTLLFRVYAFRGSW